LLAKDGARLTLADANADRAVALADELGARAVLAEEIMTVEADVFSPNALGAILTAQSIPLLAAPIVAGGANNQLATAADAARLHARDILYAPDYVINAGGIINVASEYFRLGDRIEVDRRIAQIPGRLKAIWAESAASGEPAAEVADAMARKLIGRV
jgi:leucine dehydrogenase